MRSLWRERRMATACRDHTQCADGVKAVGVAGGVFTRTSQASAFSVSQPGGPGLASRAQDTLAFGGIGGANRRHGPGVRSLARPCLATPPTTANSFYCVLMLAYCLRRRSNPPSTRQRPRKTIVTRGLDFHLWKFALTCARFLGIRCHSEGYRLIGGGRPLLTKTPKFEVRSHSPPYLLHVARPPGWSIPLAGQKQVPLINPQWAEVEAGLAVTNLIFRITPSTSAAGAPVTSPW